MAIFRKRFSKSKRKLFIISFPRNFLILLRIVQWTEKFNFKYYYKTNFIFIFYNCFTKYYVGIIIITRRSYNEHEWRGDKCIKAWLGDTKQLTSTGPINSRVVKCHYTSRYILRIILSLASPNRAPGLWACSQTKYRSPDKSRQDFSTHSGVTRICLRKYEILLHFPVGPTRSHCVLEEASKRAPGLIINTV